MSRAERIWGPFIDGKGMELTVRVHYRGKWRIESEMLEKPVFGKATMVVEIRDPRTNQVVNYAPEHSEICDGILDAMLHAELDNDTFVFEDGAFGKKSRRPTEIFKKIEEIRAKLTQWEERATKAGFKPPATRLLDFL